MVDAKLGELKDVKAVIQHALASLDDDILEALMKESLRQKRFWLL